MCLRSTSTRPNHWPVSHTDTPLTRPGEVALPRHAEDKKRAKHAQRHAGGLFVPEKLFVTTSDSTGEEE